VRSYTKGRMKNRLHATLMALGVTETDWAREHGFDQGHINRIKNRRIEPTGHMMLRICKALGKPVDEVFWLDEAPKPNARMDEAAHYRSQFPS
jgi:DNA-binding XRE family transcriptional regulator